LHNDYFCVQLPHGKCLYYIICVKHSSYFELGRKNTNDKLSFSCLLKSVNSGHAVHNLVLLFRVFIQCTHRYYERIQYFISFIYTWIFSLFHIVTIYLNSKLQSLFIILYLLIIHGACWTIELPIQNIII